MASRGAVEGFRAWLVKGVTVSACLALGLGGADAQPTSLMTHLCSFRGRYQGPGSGNGVE